MRIRRGILYWIRERNNTASERGRKESRLWKVEMWLECDLRNWASALLTDWAVWANGPGAPGDWVGEFAEPAVEKYEKKLAKAWQRDTDLGCHVCHCRAREEDCYRCGARRGPDREAPWEIKLREMNDDDE